MQESLCDVLLVLWLNFIIQAFPVRLASTLSFWSSEASHDLLLHAYFRKVVIASFKSKT